MTGRRHFPSGYAIRILAGGLALTFLAAAVAGLSPAGDPEPKKADDPAAKTQRPPEDEDPDAKPVKTHKVSVDEPDDVGPKAAAPRAVDLAEAAKDAKNSDVKRLFRELAVPHDVVKYEFDKMQKQNVVPIPDYIGTNRDAIPDPLTVTPFPPTSWTPGVPVAKKKATIVAVKPYEELALDAVKDFLANDYSKSADPQMVLSRYDQDVAAEQALTAVLLFHQSAMERGGRRGDGWRPVEDALKQKLLDVLLDELKQLTEANPPDWDAAFALTKRLAATYHGEQDRERIATPLTELVKALFQKASSEEQKAEARRKSLQLADLFPRSQVLAPVTDALHEQAKALLAEAKEEKNPERMGRLLNEAAEAWPTLPDLRAFRLERNKEHPTLRVGVRELPALMSPASAVSDSDLRAVELLFESLMKLSPDGAGGCRWEPELAEGRPRMTPRGREFRLPENACWSNGDLLRAIDVRSTVERLKAGKSPRRPRVWADLLEDVNVADPTRVSLTLRQGWLDPLAPMNFKLLPSGPAPDSAAFAEHPLGSGPFVYGGTGKKDGHDCVYFTANPYYGARKDKAGLPHLQEIRFYAYTDAVKEAPHFDLILDLTAKEAAALRKEAPTFSVNAPPAAVPNRRVYFLAVNHRNFVLANAAFRRALAYAVDRTALLDECFREKKGELHAPLNGPYPAKSWAANPGLAPRNVEDAKAEMSKAGLREIPTLSLKYPLGDPAVKDAMEKLCAGMKDSLGVKLTPMGESGEQLRKDVEDTHNYDLAYYHYDYPDDVYWLGPLLEPARDNYLDYHGALTGMVRDESRQRYFGEVRARAHELHDRFFNQEMPFIPLWQLDPLAFVGNGVAAPPFDPLLVFTDAEQWKLK